MATHTNGKGNGNGNTSVQTFSTRLVKGGPKHDTKLSMDWEGVTQEALRALAARAVVIDYQRVRRDAGSVLPEDKIKVADFMAGKGRPARVMTAEKMLSQVPKLAADPKVAEDLIRQLQASLKASKAAKK